LQQGEERLHDGVVPGRGDPAHGSDQAGVGELTDERVPPELGGFNRSSIEYPTIRPEYTSVIAHR
jgi:hypothetical protein